MVLACHCLALTDKRADAASVEMNGTCPLGLVGSRAVGWGEAARPRLEHALYSLCSWAARDPHVGTL